MVNGVSLGGVLLGDTCELRIRHEQLGTRFRLTFGQRSNTPTFQEGSPSPTPRVPFSDLFDSSPSRAPKLSLLQPLVGLVAVVLLLGLGYLLGRSTRGQENVAGRKSQDLETLWAPFLSRKLPLILSIEDPIFAEIRSNPGVYVRDRSMNEWSDVVSSAALNKLTGALNQSEMHPSRYYTAFGEAEASFLLGGLLKTPESALSIVRTSQLSWQQLADNNVIFVGVQNLFFYQLRNIMRMSTQLRRANREQSTRW
jgi:hypothetical protein